MKETELTGGSEELRDREGVAEEMRRAHNRARLRSFLGTIERIERIAAKAIWIWAIGAVLVCGAIALKEDPQFFSTIGSELLAYARKDGCEILFFILGVIIIVKGWRMILALLFAGLIQVIFFIGVLIVVYGIAAVLGR